MRSNVASSDSKTTSLLSTPLEIRIKVCEKMEVEPLLEYERTCRLTYTDVAKLDVLVAPEQIKTDNSYWSIMRRRDFPHLCCPQIKIPQSARYIYRVGQIWAQKLGNINDEIRGNAYKSSRLPSKLTIARAELTSSIRSKDELSEYWKNNLEDIQADIQLLRQNRSALIKSRDSVHTKIDEFFSHEPRQEVTFFEDALNFPPRATAQRSEVARTA